MEGGAKRELGGPHRLNLSSFQMYGRPSNSPWSISWTAVRADTDAASLYKGRHPLFLGLRIQGVA